MTTVILLKVVNGSVMADANGNPVNKGNVRADKGSVVHWKGLPAGGNGDYVVKFQDLEATDPTELAWPFSDPPEPTGRLLVVPAQGQPTITTLKNESRQWRYEVSRGNAQGLDPMIIVREANLATAHRPNVYAVGAVSFLAGAVLGMLLR